MRSLFKRLGCGLHYGYEKPDRRIATRSARQKLNDKAAIMSEATEEYTSPGDPDYYDDCYDDADYAFSGYGLDDYFMYDEMDLHYDMETIRFLEQDVKMCEERAKEHRPSAEVLWYVVFADLTDKRILFERQDRLDKWNKLVETMMTLKEAA